MAITLSGKIALNFMLKLWDSLDLTTAKDELAKEYTQLFATGEGANQADMVWHDTRTLGASATEDLDFAGGITNAFGVVCTIKAIKAIFIRAAAANTNNVVISRPAVNGLVLFGALSDALAGLKPGGMFLFTDPSAAGLVVTAATGDLLTITNSAGTTGVTYDIVIIGTV